jgi:hypothetical protein
MGIIEKSGDKRGFDGIVPAPFRAAEATPQSASLSAGAIYDCYEAFPSTPYNAISAPALHARTVFYPITS